MFNKYLIETFIPWSINVDYKNAVTIINKEKEKYICDMYNHFATSFKELAVYELHMFRVSTSKINTIDSEIISIRLQDDNYHSIHFVYNDSQCYYFILDRKLDLIENNKVVGIIQSDLSNIQSIISNYIFSK